MADLPVYTDDRNLPQGEKVLPVYVDDRGPSIQTAPKEGLLKGAYNALFGQPEEGPLPVAGSTPGDEFPQKAAYPSTMSLAAPGLVASTIVTAPVATAAGLALSAGGAILGKKAGSTIGEMMGGRAGQIRGENIGEQVGMFGAPALAGKMTGGLSRFLPESAAPVGEPAPPIAPEAPAPVPPPPSSLLDAQGRPLTPPAETPQIIQPGPEPNPAAQLISPSGQPIASDTAAAFDQFRQQTQIKGQQEAAGQYILDTMEQQGVSPQKVVSDFWQTTYPSLPEPTQKIFENYVKKVTGLEPGQAVSVDQKGTQITAKSWGDVYPPDQAPHEVSHIEGSERGLIALMAEANRRVQAGPPTEPTPSPLADALKAQPEPTPPLPPAGEPNVGEILAGKQAEGLQQAAENVQRLADTGHASPETAKAINKGVAPMLKDILTSQKGAVFIPPPRPQMPLEELIATFGEQARDIQYKASQHQFEQMHNVADQAWADLPRMAALVDKITPDKRLGALIHEAILGPGAAQDMANSQLTNSARFMQRYSALSQALDAASATDPAAAALKKSLFGTPQSGFTQALNTWRGALTGTVRNAARNFTDQGASLFTNILDHAAIGAWDGILHGKTIAGGAQGLKESMIVGQTAAKRTWEGLSQFLHLAAKEPDRLQTILDKFPDNTARLLYKPEGQEGIKGWYLKAANAPTEMQEMFHRKVWEEGEIRAMLSQRGIDADKALATGEVPPDILAKATTKALYGTFAGEPRQQFARGLVELMNKNPWTHAFVPFPRYVANKIAYIVDHNPAGFFRLYTTGNARAEINTKIGVQQKLINDIKAGNPLPPGIDVTKLPTVMSKAEHNIGKLNEQLGTIDTPAEVMGKATTGVALVGMGAAFAASPLAGDHWWEIKVGDHMIDMRPFGTIAQTMFLGRVAKEIYDNVKAGKGWHPSMSNADFGQGLAIAGARAGVGLTLMDWFSGRGVPTADTFTGWAADLVGMFGAGLFNPIAQFKDLASSVEGATGKNLGEGGIPQQALQRDLKDTPLSRLVGPTLNQIPGADQLLPARASPTSATPKHTELPLTHFLGANVTTPNPFERATAQQQTDRAALYPRSADPETQRLITKGQGQFIDNAGNQMVQAPDFQSAPDWLKNQIISDLLSSGKNIGRVQLPPALLKGEILRGGTLGKILKGK